METSYFGEYTIIVPSNRENLKEETINHLISIGEFPIYKNGNGYPSFSKLINDCVVECPTEIVVICNDRARPTKENLVKLLDLIKEGYGFVGLYSFGFFGFKKELVRQIGFMDERFVGGNYEDCDYQRRMLENDISMYITYETQYRTEISSNWDNSQTKKHYDSKWINGDGYIQRLIPEENYDYNIGNKTNEKFLSWDKSILINSQYFVDYKLKK
jgi:hypothetical protein